MSSQTDPLLPESLPARISRELAAGTQTGAALPAAPGLMESPLGGRGGPTASAGAGLAAIFRQKWLILGIFAVICALGAPPPWLFMKPAFESKAVVQVSPSASRLVYQTDQNGIVPFYESYLNTQVSIIRSPTVLQRVIDRESVRKSHWYTEERKSLRGESTPPLEKLTESLIVSPRPRTHLIDVAMSTQHPEDAKLIVDAAVDEYLRYVEETGRNEEAMLLETLRNEQKTRQDRITGYRKTRDLLSERPGLFDSEQLRAALGAHLTALESRRGDLQREVTMMRWKIDRLTPAKNGTTSAPASEPAPADEPPTRFAVDAEWRQLDAQHEQAKLALAVASQTYGKASTRIKELTATAKHAERMLRKREEQLKTASRMALASQPGGGPGSLPDFADPHVMADLVAARQKEIELLDRDIEEQRSKAGTAQELGRIEDLIKHEEEVYNDVSKRVNVLEMESKSPTRIEIVAHGLTPSKPSKDQRLLMSLMAICAAGGCALAVGYLRALGDSHIREPQQVRYATHVPFLGQLPELRAREVPKVLGGENQTLQSAPDLLDALIACPPQLMEGVRMIRTALLDRLDKNRPHVLLVTSPMPRSGKTSFTVMLSSSLALLGKKVLLVEVDLYRPSLSGRLGVNQAPGLTQLLHGHAVDNEVITRGRGLPFDLLPAGEVRAESESELLANGVFTSCLARWSSCYDVILLDGPPVLAVADSRIVARHCEGIVMVMRASHDRRGDATEAYAAMADSGRNVLGTVLIGGQSRSGRSYGYGREYYSYSRRDSLARHREAETAGENNILPARHSGN